MLPKEHSSGSYFVTLSHYNRLRTFRSESSGSSSSSSDFPETIASSSPTNPTHQASPFLYHFDEISRAIRDPLSEHISSSSSWICTLREQKAIVFRRRVLNGEIIQSTLSTISGIRHPSLATLLGVALNGDHIFIIYEYIADSASLKQCLNSSSFSNWVSRMHVALDVAKGLEHIHCDHDMVHAMIRSSSIMVTEPSFNAKIVLFGAASDPAASADEDVELRAERLAGHWFSIEEPTGYVAPEVLAGGGRMSRESDVFAFGMLILELVSGKTPLEYRMNKITLKCERISVVETAKHAVGSAGDELEMEERERRIRMWADQKLDNSFPKGVAEELIRLGLLCVEEDPSLRPEMASVTGTIAKLFQDSIDWEQRGSLAQAPFPGPSQAERGKGPSTSNTSSSTTTNGMLSSSGYSIDDVCPEGRTLENPNLRVFSFAELRSMTKNFRPEAFLGEGGFGWVFKGWVDEKTLNPAKNGHGMAVAVKKWKPESMQGLEEWQSEVDILGRLSHPNLVKLLGHCREDKGLLLVYEFMAKGSLENHLFMRGAAYEPLPWSLRLKIAHGAARGLAFLHTSEMQIIYRAFKPSNILLDSNYNPKLCDFSLARNSPTGGDSQVTTGVMGTFGYIIPEYVTTGHFYMKSDVYVFGVVLLEMLSGQRANDTNRPRWQHNLVDWAKPLLADRKKLARLMDPRLEGQYPSKGAFLAAQLTLRCLADEPKSRPSMKEVVENFEQIEAMTSRSRQSQQAASQPTTRSHGHSHSATPHRPPLHARPDGAQSSPITLF